MKLKLERIFRGHEYTIGKLYIDGEYFCDTLEDCDRGLRQDQNISIIKRLKVFSETAIPIGTYEVCMTIKSPKYGRIMPRLLNVKGYEGVLIHSGNTAEDTCGCILVGENKVKGKVINSRVTFDRLFKVLQEASDNGEKITLTII